MFYIHAIFFPKNIFDTRWVEPMDRENPPTTVGKVRNPYSELKTLSMIIFSYLKVKCYLLPKCKHA